MTETLKKRIRMAAALVVAVIMLAGAGILLWFGSMQASVQLLYPQETSVLCKTQDAKEGARAWMETFLEQYRQKYVWAASRLDSYTIDKVQLEDEGESPTAVIGFTIRPTIRYNDEFIYWGVGKGAGIACEWTVRFKVDKETGGYRFSYMEPAGHGALNVPGKQDTPCVYTLGSGKVKVSYDAGESFTTLPVPLKELARAWDKGGARGVGLAKGSYILTHQKTAFLYGGGEDAPLQILYSDDEGATFEISVIDDSGMRVRGKYCAFPTPQAGYVVASGNRTERQEQTCIYKTADGGKTWHKVGDGPESGLLYSATFLTENLGFIGYAPVFLEDAGVDVGLYRTTDGGKSFEQMQFPLPSPPGGWAQSDWENVFRLPSAPKQEEDQLVCYLAQGDRGTYKDGIIAAKYVSTNNGNSWIYIGEEVPSEEVQFIS